MSLKPKLEAIIYAAEEPVTLNELVPLLKDAALAQPLSGGSEPEAQDEKEQLKATKARISSALDELIADYASSDRGMEIRQVAGGYRMATKPEHHDVVVGFVKALKPPVRLSLQA